MSHGAPTSLTATVCFIRRDGKLLLQRRPVGRTWAGRLNGPGGKVDANEAPLSAVTREVWEETGLRITTPIHHGTIGLVFGVPATMYLHVNVYVCSNFSGRTRGKEGCLRWYSEARLPFDAMWPDMRFWLPGVLAGGSIAGMCTYDAAGDRLLDYALHLTGSWSGEDR